MGFFLRDSEYCNNAVCYGIDSTKENITNAQGRCEFNLIRGIEALSCIIWSNKVDEHNQNLKSIDSFGFKPTYGDHQSIFQCTYFEGF